MPRPPSLVSQEAFTVSYRQELLQNPVAWPLPGTWGGPSRTDPLVAAGDTSLSRLCEGREKGLEFDISRRQSLAPRVPMLLLTTAAHGCTAGQLPRTLNQHVFQMRFTYSLSWPFQIAALCLC